jgi:folate-dependent phosphoribosylglycinamide formyltransferase PurN
VLAAGVPLSGATVHFVDEVYDHGPLIAQWPVPVAADDTAESLAARVLRIEHVLYPRVIDAVAAGRIVLDDDNRVRRIGAAIGSAVFTVSDGGGSSLETSIDRMLGA